MKGLVDALHVALLALFAPFLAIAGLIEAVFKTIALIIGEFSL